MFKNEKGNIAQRMTDPISGKEKKIMTHNVFFVYGKCIFSLLLLISCCSFVYSEDIKIYPDKIMCIVDRYVASSSSMQKISGNVKEMLWKDLLKECRFRRVEDTIISNIQVKSTEAFLLERKKEPQSFRLEIWTLETSADANKLFILLHEWGHSSSLIEKLPKRFFVYENYFILLVINSVNGRHIIQEGVSEIIQTCFECGTIDVGYTLAYVGDKEGCGRLYHSTE